jgi:ribosome-binding protein aMBF1 (putative translation factor)
MTGENGYYSRWTKSHLQSKFALTMGQIIENNLKCLGDIIRAARKARGWSQEEFAYQCDLDRSYIGGIERGERNISVLTLCKIAKALKLNVNSLVKGLPLGGK